MCLSVRTAFPEAHKMLLLTSHWPESHHVPVAKPVHGRGNRDGFTTATGALLVTPGSHPDRIRTDSQERVGEEKD